MNNPGAIQGYSPATTFRDDSITPFCPSPMYSVGNRRENSVAEFAWYSEFSRCYSGICSSLSQLNKVLATLSAALVGAMASPPSHVLLLFISGYSGYQMRRLKRDLPGISKSGSEVPKRPAASFATFSTRS